MRLWRPSSTNGMPNDWGYRPWAWLIVLVLALLAAACPVPTKTDVEVAAETLHVTNEAIILFPASHEWATKGFARCLRTELEKRVTPKPKIMDTAAFQVAMFPWFESEHAPRTVGELNALLSRPLVRQRIASLNVRYLIRIAGDTEVHFYFPVLEKELIYY